MRKVWQRHMVSVRMLRSEPSCCDAIAGIALRISVCGGHILAWSLREIFIPPWRMPGHCARVRSQGGRRVDKAGEMEP